MKLSENLNKTVTLDIRYEDDDYDGSTKLDVYNIAQKYIIKNDGNIIYHSQLHNLNTIRAKIKKNLRFGLTINKSEKIKIATYREKSL